MAGYDWSNGKSNNAVLAEDYGMVTKSRITRAWLADNDIDESVAFIKWLIAMRRISFSEWHHTSKFFNRTGYYAGEDIKEQLADMDKRGMLEGYRRAFRDPGLRGADAREVADWVFDNRK